MPHRLCNHFTAHGWCRKAETCTFAHGIQELHPDVQAQMGLTPQVLAGPQPVVAPTVTVPAKSQPVVKAATVDAKTLASAPKVQMLGLSTSGPVVSQSAKQAGGDAAKDDPNFKFNTGAAPFVPTTFLPAGEGAVAGEEQEPTSDSGSSPGKRRPAPAPLTSLDETTPSGGGAASLMSIPALASPVTIKTVLRPSMVSPIGASTRVISLRQPLASPKMIQLSPTSQMASTASGVAMSAIATPTPAQVPLGSPTGALTSGSYVLRSPTGAWPTSPTVLLSPKPGTPAPISRNMLLQARNVAVRLQEGPPGLANYAPTPTTKSKNLGFIYPQPGYIAAMPRKVQVLPQAQLQAQPQAQPQAQ